MEYAVNVTRVETSVTVHHATTATGITITGLQPFTTYSCAVAARNSISTGPFSEAVIIRTQESGKFLFNVKAVLRFTLVLLYFIRS